jgi:hypothetical protein
MVKCFASLDIQGILHTLFELPDDLSQEAAYACIREEGWIIGGDMRRLNNELVPEN